jgi:CDP-diacylglycerol--glycerol-3-phosphate 3-phosphatidyltransferase
MKKRIKEEIKENVCNVPNFLTLLRGIGAIILVYLIFSNYPKLTITIVFLAFAITDGMDGFIARKFNQKTRFGKYFDPVMDRVFMISFVAALIIKFGIINDELIFKLLPLAMTREIIALPAYLFLRKGDVKIEVKPVGKIATIMQSITLPVILLGWGISILMVLLTCLVGIFSGVTYVIDSYNPLKDDLKKEGGKNVRTGRRKA